MIIRISKEYFIDTFKRRVVKISQNNSQIVAFSALQNSVTHISPKFMAFRETQNNLYIAFYNPGQQTTNDRVQLIIINKNNLSEQRYGVVQNVLKSDLAPEMTPSNSYILDYYIDILGLEEEEDNASLLILVRCKYKSNSIKKIIGKVVVVNSDTNQTNLAIAATITENNISGSFQVVTATNSLTTTVNVVTYYSEQVVRRILLNIISIVEGTIYTLEEYTQGSQTKREVVKYKIEYDVRRTTVTNIAHVLTLSQSVGKIENLQPQEKNNIEVVSSAPSFMGDTGNIFIISEHSGAPVSIANEVSQTTIGSYNFRRVRFYANTSSSMRIQYRSARDGSINYTFPNVSPLVVSTNIPELKWGGYITVYQLQKYKKDNVEKNNFLEKIVDWCNNEKPLTFFIKEGVQEIIIIFHTPDDYVEVPITESNFNNLSTETKNRINGNVIVTTSNITISVIPKNFNDANSTNVTSKVLLANEEGIHYWQFFSKDDVRTTLGRNIKGTKRWWGEAKYKGNITNSPSTNTKTVEHIKATITIKKEALNSIATNNIIFPFLLSITSLSGANVSQIQSNDVEYDAQLMEIDTGRLRIKGLTPSNKVKIKDVNVFIRNNNTIVKRYKHNINYLSYEYDTGSVIVREAFADITLNGNVSNDVSDYQKIGLRFSLADELPQNYTYDKMDIVLFFEIEKDDIVQNLPAITSENARIYIGDSAMQYHKGSNQNGNMIITRKIIDLGDEKNLVKPSDFTPFYYYLLPKNLALVGNNIRNPVPKKVIIVTPYHYSFRAVEVNNNTLIIMVKKNKNIYIRVDDRNEIFGLHNYDGKMKALVKNANELFTNTSGVSVNYDATLERYVITFSTNKVYNLYGTNSTEENRIIEGAYYLSELINTGGAINILKLQATNTLETPQTTIDVLTLSNGGITINTRYITNYSNLNLNINNTVSTASPNSPARLNAEIRRHVTQIYSRNAINIQEVLEEETKTAEQIIFWNTYQTFHIPNKNFLNSINNILSEVKILYNNNTYKMFIIPNTIRFKTDKNFIVTIKENISSISNLPEDALPLSGSINNINTIFTAAWSSITGSNNPIVNQSIGSDQKLQYTFYEESGEKKLNLGGTFIKNLIIPLVYLHVLGFLTEENIITEEYYRANNQIKIYQQIKSKLELIAPMIDNITFGQNTKWAVIGTTITNKQAGIIKETYRKIIEHRSIL